jgi:hypothetical protein
MDYPGRPILWAKIAIRQLGYFLVGARLLDLVQCRLHRLLEAGIRVRRLAHLLWSRRKNRLRL